MPDWEGEELNLVQWFAQGPASPYIGITAKDTVILDEFTRITGISWDEEMSFDNGSFSPDSRIAKILANDTWPDVGYNIQLSLIERLAEGDYIWDLTELIPKYMPNLMKIMNYNEKSKIQFEAKKMDGKFWYVPKPTWRGPAVLDPDYSEDGSESAPAQVPHHTSRNIPHRPCYKMCLRNLPHPLPGYHL